jgi:hypothetical protein
MISFRHGLDKFEQKHKSDRFSSTTVYLSILNAQLFTNYIAIKILLFKVLKFLRIPKSDLQGRDRVPIGRILRLQEKPKLLRILHNVSLNGLAL